MNRTFAFTAAVAALLIFATAAPLRADPDFGAEPAYAISKLNEIGIGSWYGPGFHGRVTANGEIYDQNKLTAAHPTLPMSSWIQVTNLDNNRSVLLRVNDRGPYVGGRIVDVSRRAAQVLDFETRGLAKLLVEVVE